MKFNWLLILITLILISFILLIIGSKLFFKWMKDNKCCKNTDNFKKCFPSKGMKDYNSICLPYR
jgi:hypothetical protein